MARYLTLQNNTDTAIVAGDLLGQIQFASSADSDGGDAIKITASIASKAEGTFSASANPASIIFSTGPSSTPTERIKINNSGHLIPMTNHLYDLGSSSSGFRYLHISGIYFDGLGPQTLPFNDFNVAANTDTVTVTDGNTITFTGAGDNVVSRNGQTIIISGTGTAGGGGGTPGGAQYQIQINDGAGGFTSASANRFIYDTSTNTFSMGPSGVSTSGTQVTNTWYTTNLSIGGGNFVSMSSNSQYNTAIGIDAAAGLLTLSNNGTFLGYKAFENGTKATNSIVIGSYTAQDAAQIQQCTIIGDASLKNQQTSVSRINTLGYNVLNSLNSASSPSAITAIGNNAGQYYNYGNGAALNNIFIGDYNSFHMVTGVNNVVIGDSADGGSTNHTTNYNVLIGTNIYQSSTTSDQGDYNVVIGSNAARYSHNNGRNVVIGYNVSDYIRGQSNIVIGYKATAWVDTFGNGMRGTGNIILSADGLYGNGGMVLTDTQKLLIGDTLGGDLLNNRIKIGGSNIVDVDTAVLEVECNTSTDVGLLVQGAASQSANLTEWQNSTSVVQAYVDATGGISGTSYTFGDGTIQTTAAVGGGTPGGNSTEFQYNNGGSFEGTSGVVYGGVDGTGILLKVQGTGGESLFSVEYTGTTTQTSVSIYRNNATDTANLFQVRTEASGDLFTVSPSGKLYYQSSYSKIIDEGTASSLTFNLDEANIFTGTINSTTSTVSTINDEVGQRFITRLKNGVANAKVTTWFGNRVSWPGGSIPSGSLANGDANLFGFLVTSGTSPTFYYDGFLIATGLK